MKFIIGSHMGSYIMMLFWSVAVTLVARGTGAPLSAVGSPGDVEEVFASLTDLPTDITSTVAVPETAPSRVGDKSFTYTAKIGKLRFAMTTTVTVDDTEEAPLIADDITDDEGDSTTATTAETTPTLATDSKRALGYGKGESRLNVFRSTGTTTASESKENFVDLTANVAPKHDACVETWGRVPIYRVGNYQKEVRQPLTCKRDCMTCSNGAEMGLIYYKSVQLVRYPVQQTDGTILYDYVQHPVWLVAGCGCVIA